MKPGITVHCRVRNEEYFARAALQSVLPLAEKILVYDTGSSDSTVLKILKIESDKIELVRKKASDPAGICEYRNEMIEKTETEWFMLVDGDEIYPPEAAERILQEMNSVPPNMHRIKISRRHFYDGFKFISPPDSLGRIYRTEKVRFRLYNESDNRVGHETPYLRGQASIPRDRYTLPFPEDIFFFHCHFLKRSSRDSELGNLRGWRKPPFPLVPYTGVLPEGVEAEPGNASWARCLYLNIKNFCIRLGGFQ